MTTADPNTTSTKWVNWGGNQSCEPLAIERPYNEGQLQQIVRDAATAGKRVRAAGSGHSFTAAVCTDDVLVSLEHMNLMQSIDHDNSTVTVGAGITLHSLNRLLAKAGLAMTNLGDIAYQSLAGAISTGTHGTGLGFGGMSTQLRGLRLVTVTGDIVDCSRSENADLFHVARVGLGVFGLITSATIAVEPAFNLHAVEEPALLDDVLDNWASLIEQHDHYEFFWIPGQNRAMTKANRRTLDAAKPPSKAVYVRDKVLAENVAFGAMCKLAALRPSIVPKLGQLLTSAVSRSEYTNSSDKVFASPRWVKFIEMEYSVPVADLPTVLRKIDEAVRSAGMHLLFPIEARAAAADDIPLSTAEGRDSGYVAVHRLKGQPYRAYFELVEAIVSEHDGRPHWGKMHFKSATALRSRYPQWDEFQRVRADYDPTGMFTNDYTDRVLGPAA